MQLQAGRQAGRQADRQRSERQGDLLTVLDPWGRVQPDTDLFEPWRLEGSRLTLTHTDRTEKERR